MVAVEAIAQAPMWAKAGGLLVLANEVRGCIVAAGIAADYRAHGLHAGQLWVLPLILLVPLVALAWKRETARRRIARRLAL